MNKQEYLKFHAEVCQKLQDITAKKNADYTGVSDDPFSNFSKVEELGVTTTEQGFLVRMLDKFMRITSFVQKGVLEVKEESVEDTLLDLANYCILMAGFIESRKKRGTNSEQAAEQICQGENINTIESIIDQYERGVSYRPPTRSFEIDADGHYIPTDEGSLSKN